MEEEKLVKNLALAIGLGEIKNVERVSGGLTHKMYKVVSNSGIYAVKHLNPNIMKRSSAHENFARAEELEKKLRKNFVNSIYALEFGGKLMQEFDGEYFYIYPWFDGKPKEDKNVTIDNCKVIASELAKIHNIEHTTMQQREEEYIDSQSYYHRLKDFDFFEDFCEIVPKLEGFLKEHNKRISNIPLFARICHNDLDEKNVLWSKGGYKVIDLECLQYGDPYLEFFETCLAWSGIESYSIDFRHLEAFKNAYMDEIKFDFDVNLEDLYYGSISRLFWLEYNLRRAVGEEGERNIELGKEEVKKTLSYLEYYFDSKEKIISVLKK